MKRKNYVFGIFFSCSVAFALLSVLCAPRIYSYERRKFQNHWTRKIHRIFWIWMWFSICALFSLIYCIKSFFFYSLLPFFIIFRSEFSVFPRFSALCAWVFLVLLLALFYFFIFFDFDNIVFVSIFFYFQFLYGNFSLNFC